MSKAENYIRKNTNQFSNEDGFDYVPWLTPDQARKAVEIAREEMIEKALITFQVVCNRSAKLLSNCETYCNVCKQFKQAIRDE